MRANALKGLGSAVTIFAVCLLAWGSCLAQDAAGDSTAPAAGDAENASNPLARVKNTDVRAQYFDLKNGSELRDYWLADGAFMVTDSFKIKYELHYWDTDITGTSESDVESIRIKPIFFLNKGKLGGWKYQIAVGLDWILDFNHRDKGIGSGSDQIAPFFGVALKKPNWVLIPLLQHFTDYNGVEVSLTAARLIVLQTLPAKAWLKYDIKVPVDWLNDNAIPATVEAQLGKMFTNGFGAYADVLAGIGNDRPYDWGIGVGVRFVY